MGSSCSSKDVELSIEIIDHVIDIAKTLVNNGQQKIAKKLLVDVNIDKAKINEILKRRSF